MGFRPQKGPVLSYNWHVLNVKKHISFCTEIFRSQSVHYTYQAIKKLHSIAFLSSGEGRGGEYFLVRGQLEMSYEWFTTRCNAVVAFSWELRKGMQNFGLPNWMKEMETRITEKGRDDICIWLKLTSVCNRPKPFQRTAANTLNGVPQATH